MNLIINQLQLQTLVYLGFNKLIVYFKKILLKLRECGCSLLGLMQFQILLDNNSRSLSPQSRATLYLRDPKLPIYHPLICMLRQVSQIYSHGWRPYSLSNPVPSSLARGCSVPSSASLRFLFCLLFCRIIYVLCFHLWWSFFCFWFFFVVMYLLYFIHHFLKWMNGLSIFLRVIFF